MAVAEAHFPAMGSRVHLKAVDAPPGALEQGRLRIEELEGRWSRFRPESELSRLNASWGRHIEVSGDTLELVDRSIEAWKLTRGLFDPTVHDAVIAAGYRKDFGATFGGAAFKEARPALGGAPGLDRVVRSREKRTVCLPIGVRLDPGGIGKGLAADVVARELVASGAAGATVNVGGDIRMIGVPDSSRGWVVASPSSLSPRARKRPTWFLAGFGGEADASKSTGFDRTGPDCRRGSRIPNPCVARVSAAQGGS